MYLIEIFTLGINSYMVSSHYQSVWLTSKGNGDEQVSTLIQPLTQASLLRLLEGWKWEVIVGTWTAGTRNYQMNSLFCIGNNHLWLMNTSWHF